MKPLPEPARSASELITACLQANSESAWREFVSRFQPLIASVVLRTLRRYGQVNPGLTDDLVQETFLRLCKDQSRVLREFEHRHEDAIFGYVKVVAASIAMDYCRSRLTQKRNKELPSDGVDRDLGVSSASMEQDLLLREIERFVEQISDSNRDRAIFWFYYRHGYSARDIAEFPGVDLTIKGVESCIYRLTEALRRKLASSEKNDCPKGNFPQSTLGEIK